MTRTKSARQVGRNPFARLPILKEARVPISPKYTIELALHDADGDIAVWLGWEPYPPSETEQNALSERIDEALAPFFQEACTRVRFLEGGAS
jgi:hypothetical protein